MRSDPAPAPGDPPGTARPHSPGATEPPTDSPPPSRARAYYELTKPRIALFAMMTAGAAYHIASAGSGSLAGIFHTLLGTVLATAGALALNQYLERDLDALMERTRGRPLPSGRLRPRDALLFGLLLVVGGVAHLWVTAGVLPAALTVGSAVAYNLVYTPLKSRSHTATFIGAVPGAMPALIGWSAAQGSLGPGASVLFAIAFLWQIPHVLALAWLLREDYARAGFLLSPPADAEGKMIGRLMGVYSATLLLVSLMPTVLGLTGLVYLVGAFVLGVAFLLRSLRAWRTMSRRTVRRVFLGSLAYQPLLFGLMVLDVVRR